MSFSPCTCACPVVVIQAAFNYLWVYCSIYICVRHQDQVLIPPRFWLITSEDLKPFAREAVAELQKRRIAGSPLIHEAEAAGPDRLERGLVLEFGTWLGGSARALAEATGNRITVHSFDSFTTGTDPSSLLNFHGPYARLVLEEENMSFIEKVGPSLGGSNVELHPGLVHESLPAFLATQSEEAAISLLHIDAQLFDAPRFILEVCRRRMVAGTIIVFDDFMQGHEMQAFFEFQRRYGFAFSYLSWGYEANSLYGPRARQHFADHHRRDYFLDAVQCTLHCESWAQVWESWHVQGHYQAVGIRIDEVGGLHQVE